LGQQATGVGIAAAICGEPRRPTNHPCENERAGYKSPHPHLSEGRGEVFFLDILFYRKSVIAWLNYASTQLQEAGRFVGEFIDVRHAPEWLGKCCSKVETLMYSATRICFINPPLICVFQR
jgi:hypothetical protein